MATDLGFVLNLLFGNEREKRYTQDSPILPEVWLEYFKKDPGDCPDLLLYPDRKSSPGVLRTRIFECLKILNHKKYKVLRRALVYNETHLVGELSFTELLFSVLPLTYWWNIKCCDKISGDKIIYKEIKNCLEGSPGKNFSGDFLWLLQLVGYYYYTTDIIYT